MLGSACGSGVGDREFSTGTGAAMGVFGAAVTGTASSVSGCGVALAALPIGAEYPMEMPTTLTKPLY